MGIINDIKNSKFEEYKNSNIDLDSIVETVNELKLTMPINYRIPRKVKKKLKTTILNNYPTITCLKYTNSYGNYIMFDWYSKVTKESGIYQVIINNKRI